MHGPSDVVPLPARTDAIVERIQERIHSGELPIGSWLRQDLLSDEFGVSRTPVRQALDQLRDMGLLELIPHRGARVRGPSERDIREAYGVRAVLEGYAAERAARYVTTSQLERLSEAEGLFGQAVAAWRKRGPPAIGAPDWSRANNQFHEVILEAADSDRLTSTIHALHRSFPRNLTWQALGDDVRLLESNVAEHRRIREAIESRRAGLARRLMVRHVEHSGDLVATRAAQTLQAARPT